MIDKLKFVLSSKNKRSDLVNSVLNTKTVHDIPVNVISSRIDSINKFTKNKDFTVFLENFKRINNILKSKKFSNNEEFKIDTKFFETIEEENIYNLIKSFSREICKKGMCEKSQDLLINSLIKMNYPITIFFENVIVNHDDKTIKTNRLNLLKNLHNSILKFSNFNYIEN
tara:strand:- start:52 stop:561 length:510 start_codon:yes stop_codon:yes gene_type:complete